MKTTINKKLEAAQEAREAKAQKIAALIIKQAEQLAAVKALKQAEHDARIQAIIDESNRYFFEHRAGRKIKTRVTPWNTPINDTLKGAR